MEETSLMRNHGGGIWRRHLDEASWMRNQGGDIMEEASWGLVGQGRSGARKCKKTLCFRVFELATGHHGGGIWRRRHG